MAVAPGLAPMATAVPEVFTTASVVVVDDSPDNVHLLREVLVRAGVGDVQGHTDPRAALAACLADPPDLVLLDLHMPGLDGLSFMEELARRPGTGFLPVILLTADHSVEARRRALGSGAKDFLLKPFDLTEVRLRVRNLLETRALYDRLEARNRELQSVIDAKDARDARARAAEQQVHDRVRAVLDGRHLAMAFQPVRELGAGRVVGAEALARFTLEPQQRPDRWFADAARVGLGVELELAAVEHAVAEVDRLPPGAFLSVNVSAVAAVDGRLDALLAPCPQRIVLELTEHTRVDDYDHLCAAIARHRERGIRIAVDDTGAGYASLQHLLRVGADIVKLDLGLTRGIDGDPVRRSLASALVTFADDVGATIIAEGIETPGELDTLRALGVPWGQGYHLGRPGPLPLGGGSPPC